MKSLSLAVAVAGLLLLARQRARPTRRSTSSA